jgi:DnaJ-class molecular chaperone
MRDPYSVLGVSRKASPGDVKTAFRGLAKQYHPDVAGGNELMANTFQEINSAYDILGDPTKRTQFDKGEIDANGTQIRNRQSSRQSTRESSRKATRQGRSSNKPSKRSSDHRSAADAWAARARAGNDRKKNRSTEEDFKAYSWGRHSATDHEKNASEPSGKPKKSRADEVFNDLFQNLRGKTEHLSEETAPRPRTAKPDHAKPPKSEKQKPNQAAEENFDAKPKTTKKTQEPLEDTHYNLSISFEEAARGTARRVKLPSGRRLDVKIPAGVKSGQQIRLKGQGKNDGVRSGDALIEINVEPHRQFTNEGEDIYLTLPISVDEAVLGAKVMVPTLDGPVAMTIPQGSNADTTLRLKGRGLPRPKNGEEQMFGDQYVTLKVILPSANDTDFIEMVERWAAKNSYDVRSDMVL